MRIPSARLSIALVALFVLSPLAGLPAAAQGDLRSVEMTLLSPSDGGPTPVEDLVYFKGSLEAEGGVGPPPPPPPPPPPGNELPIPLLSHTINGLDAMFTMSASDPDGEIATWRFEAGDGSPYIAGEGEPFSTEGHSYPAPGTYTAVLTVSDNDGASATAEETVVAVDAVGGGTILYFHRGITSVHTVDVAIELGVADAGPTMDTEKPTLPAPASTVDVTPLTAASPRNLWDPSWRSTTSHALAGAPATVIWWVQNPMTTALFASTFDLTLYQFDGTTYTVIASATAVVYPAQGQPGDVIRFEHSFGPVSTTGTHRLMVTIEPIFINVGQAGTILYDSADFPSCLVIGEGDCFDEGSDPPEPDPDPEPGGNETELSGFVLIPEPMTSVIGEPALPLLGLLSPALNGLTNYVIVLTDVESDAEYVLSAAIVDPLPDYDICFYGADAEAVLSPDFITCGLNFGDESGPIPAGAAYAVVIAFAATSPATGFTFSVTGAYVSEPGGSFPVPFLGLPTVEWPPRTGDLPSLAPMIDPPSEAPEDAEMKDDTGDVALDHMDIEAVWFEQDDEGLYVGMKLVALTAQPVTTNTIYSVNFVPSWYEPGVADGTEYLYSSLTAEFGPAAFHDPGSVVPVFWLQHTSTDGDLNFNNPETSLPGGSFDYANDIVWWVVPFAEINDPVEGDSLGALSADTGLDGAIFTFPGFDTVSTPDSFLIGGGTPPPPPPPPIPVVSIPGGPYSGVVGTPINLAGSASGISGSPQCLWTGPSQASFASANNCATAVTFSAVNANPGYTINLRVTDPADASRTDTQPTTVLVTTEGGPPPPPPPEAEPLSGSIEVRKDSCTGNVLMTHVVQTSTNTYDFSFYADLYVLPEGRHTIVLCYFGSGFAPTSVTRVVDLTKTDRGTPVQQEGPPAAMKFSLAAYHTSISPGDAARFTLTAENPAKVPQGFTATPRTASSGWTYSPSSLTDTIPAGDVREYSLFLRAPTSGGVGILEVAIQQARNEFALSASTNAATVLTPFTVDVQQVAPSGAGAYQVSLNLANARNVPVTLSGTIESAGVRVPFSVDLPAYASQILHLRIAVPSSAQTFLLNVAEGGNSPFSQSYALPPAPASNAEADTPKLVKAKNVLIETSLPTAKAGQVAVEGRVLVDGIPAKVATVRLKIDGRDAPALLTDTTGKFTLLVPSTAQSIALEAEGVQRVVFLESATAKGTEAKSLPAPSLFALLVVIGVCWGAVRRRVG